MEVVQTLLHQRKEKGIHAQIAWIPVDPRVKKGSVITLKDNPESGEWRVAELYVTRQQSEDIEHRKWGLDLPKSQRTER
jgi:hypothetical protein